MGLFEAFQGIADPGVERHKHHLLQLKFQGLIYLSFSARLLCASCEKIRKPNMN